MFKSLISFVDLWTLREHSKLQGRQFM